VIYDEIINNEPFKFKGIAKRTSQLSFVALMVSIGIAVYYFALGLTVSSIMVGCFSVAVLIILLIQLMNIVENVQPLMVTSICILLVVSSFIEGSSTGQYFYFFPVIIVIPIVVNYKESSFIELGAYFLLGLSSFFVNFYVGHNIKPIENIPAAVAHRMLFTNASCAILLTFGFALAYIYYERKYIMALIDEKNRAIAERTKFLSTMGHELRTPLNGIIGAVNIFTDDYPEYTTNEYFQILKYSWLTIYLILIK
jgi:signal transduction histidine kinase